MAHDLLIAVELLVIIACYGIATIFVALPIFLTIRAFMVRWRFGHWPHQSEDAMKAWTDIF